MNTTVDGFLFNAVTNVYINYFILRTLPPRFNCHIFSVFRNGWNSVLKIEYDTDYMIVSLDMTVYPCPFTGIKLGVSIKQSPIKMLDR